MSSNDPSIQPSPPALAAFLRGIERRAAVLAELQAGDPVAGDAAVAAAMRQWHAAAAGMTMGEWPERFWALLLAQPQLHVRTAVAVALDATDRLGELGTGPRAALLLRVAAGLDEPAAAAALGVPVPSYRLALQDALPRGPDGSPDEGSWQRLRDQVHRRIKTLSPERMSRLGSAREAVLQHEAPGAGASSSGSGASGPQRRRGGVLLALWALLALCALALVATFLPGASNWLGAAWPVHHDGDPAHNLAVLPEAPAASRFGTESGLITHRDFALLADPSAAQARDLAFHSWLATQPAAMAESPPPVAAAGHGAEATTLDSQGITSERADAPS